MKKYLQRAAIAASTFAVPGMADSALYQFSGSIVGALDPSVWGEDISGSLRVVDSGSARADGDATDRGGSAGMIELFSPWGPRGYDVMFSAPLRFNDGTCHYELEGHGFDNSHVRMYFIAPPPKEGRSLPESLDGIEFTYFFRLSEFHPISYSATGRFQCPTKSGAAPQPATWERIVIGFRAISGMRRRRRRRAAITQAKGSSDRPFRDDKHRSSGPGLGPIRASNDALKEKLEPADLEA